MSGLQWYTCLPQNNCRIKYAVKKEKKKRNDAVQKIVVMIVQSSSMFL